MSRYIEALNSNSVKCTGSPALMTIHFMRNPPLDSNGGLPQTMPDQVVGRGSYFALSKNTFTRSGYTFAGWNTAENGSGTSYPDGQSVRDITGIYDEMTLYAQWKFDSSSGFNGSNGNTPSNNANASNNTTNTSKKTNPITIKSSKKSVKASKVKKKAVKVSPLTVKKAVGTVTFKKISGSSKLTINKSSGKVTVKKKTEKGTYRALISIVAKGNSIAHPEAFDDGEPGTYRKI